MRDMRTIKDAQTLHREAMDLAEQAALAQAEGRSAKDLYAAALEKERQAAELVAPLVDLEPTRSVLFRSAASLALDCGDYRTAEQLIARALAGNPPDEIAEELRDLLEQVYFQRHLSVRGVVLSPREFQFSIAGKAVAPGIAHSAIFIERVQDLQRLVYRTAERQAQRPFRERGRRDKKLLETVDVYLSVPRASSFAITIRLGHPHQMHFPLPGDLAETVIAELLDCIDILQTGNLKDLERRIPNDAYRRNFTALARRIAPDGDAVRTVGFTAEVGGGQRRVLLTRTADKIAPSDRPKDRLDSGKLVSVQGVLKFADSTGTRHEIRIIDADDRQHRITVPEGMMDDIVRPLWDYEVQVEGIQKRDNSILLTDIRKVEEPQARNDWQPRDE